MFEHVDELISRVIDLIREHKREQRELFDGSILPLMQDFENLHDDLGIAFRLYVELITNSPEDFTIEHPIFLQITKDKLFSNDLPNKMNAVWEIISLKFSDPYDDKDKLLSFLWELNMYLTHLGSSAHEMERKQPRGSLLKVLQEIAESTASVQRKKFSALNEILGKILEMQRFYEDVEKAFQILKSDYLK